MHSRAPLACPRPLSRLGGSSAAAADACMPCTPDMRAHTHTHGSAHAHAREHGRRGAVTGPVGLANSARDCSAAHRLVRRHCRRASRVLQRHRRAGAERGGCRCRASRPAPPARGAWNWRRRRARSTANVAVALTPAADGSPRGAARFPACRAAGTRAARVWSRRAAWRRRDLRLRRTPHVGPQCRPRCRPTTRAGPRSRMGSADRWSTNWP